MFVHVIFILPWGDLRARRAAMPAVSGVDGVHAIFETDQDGPRRPGAGERHEMQPLASSLREGHGLDFVHSAEEWSGKIGEVCVVARSVHRRLLRGLLPEQCPCPLADGAQRAIR
jgi:hypothetical protein